jgi:hypothetical protein
MAAPLLEHPSISVAFGDYTKKSVGSEFSLVALLFNNIFDPRGEEAQRNCFKNAAKHLVDGGFFVIEGYILDPDQLKGEWFLSRRRGIPREREGEFELCRYNPNRNEVERTLVHKRTGGPDVVFSVLDTYADTDTLDKLADEGGFDLEKRYGGWRKVEKKFTSASSRHITVYKKRPQPGR